MTEDEARGKWCPMYRCSTDNGTLSDNATHGSSGYCCTSECMMWRWENNPVCNQPSIGYCGLGGPR